MSKSKKNTTRQPPKKEKAKDEKARDSFTNPMARLGEGQPNLLEASGYVMHRRTQDYNTMNILYRNNWIARRLIDVVPEDMMKNGYKITSQIRPEALARLEKLERKIQLRKRILNGLKWGRLYGGAVGVIVIDGQEDQLSKPLDYDTILPGAFKGIFILDRWTGVQAGAEIVPDINDSDFGLPMYYNTYSQNNGVKVHHSRVVRFTGRDLPFIEEQMEMHWGASELEHVFDEIRKRDNTSWNIAQLVFMANLRVLKMDGMEGITSTMSPKAMEALYNTLEAQNQMMNNNSMQIIGKEEDFSTHQYTFAGLSDVYETFMMDVAGAAEIPVTKLFGRSPAGMNATGESDMQNYYDSIEEKQEAYLRPIYDRLLPIMCMSEFGAIPDDLDYEFKPIRRLSDEQRVDLTSKHTTAIIEAYNAGLISQKIALKELQQMKETTGTWSNITDEDIARADDSFDFGGELPGMESMMPEPQQAMDADWKEEEHPRREDGKFGTGGSGNSEEEEHSKPDDKTVEKGSSGGNETEGEPAKKKESTEKTEEKELTEEPKRSRLKSSSKGRNIFTRGFSQRNLDRHWEGGTSDHSEQYPELDKEGYNQRALELVQMAVDDNIEGYVNKDDQVIRYDKENNDYVKGRPDQGIATLFKPTDGIEYYYRWEKREAVEDDEDE